MDYLKSVVPSQLVAERGSNIVVINPGSANIRIGLASWQTPVSVPHCIARHVRVADQAQLAKMNQEQVMASAVSPTQQAAFEEAYNIVRRIFLYQFLWIRVYYMIASHLKLQPVNQERGKESCFRKLDYSDGYSGQTQINEAASFPWTNVKVENSFEFSTTTIDPGFSHPICPADIDISEVKAGDLDRPNDSRNDNLNDSNRAYRDFICGDEALRISSDQPYCLRHPIRRGHLNVSQFYSMQQISEDLYSIWDWILREKLHISLKNRHRFSVVLVVSETFDNREIKEMLTVVLRDLQFNSAVIHQESLAATFGNGVSSACVVNIGAQVISILCIEDGVALPMTAWTLPYGGEDISRCLLWVQQHRQSWPPIDTDPIAKPIDLLMLNKLKESYCKIKEGELNAVAEVPSYKVGLPTEAYRVSFSALNVPPMGLFYPSILMPEVFPSPPRPWFNDYEDMLEDTLHTEFVKRPDVGDIFFAGFNYGLAMPDSSMSSPPRIKKEDNLVGLAQAITNSILVTGRIDLQRKLFCSIQLIGGVACTKGLVGAVEERVLHSIPAHEAIDTVEVLQQRTDPVIVSWKGGAVLGILDFSREAWIQREDWVRGGIHIGSGRKYKDSYLLQTQTLWYINS